MWRLSDAKSRSLFPECSVLRTRGKGKDGANVSVTRPSATLVESVPAMKASSLRHASHAHQLESAPAFMDTWSSVWRHQSWPKSPFQRGRSSCPTGNRNFCKQDGLSPACWSQEDLSLMVSVSAITLMSCGLPPAGMALTGRPDCRPAHKHSRN